MLIKIKTWRKQNKCSVITMVDDKREDESEMSYKVIFKTFLSFAHDYQTFGTT